MQRVGLPSGSGRRQSCGTGPVIVTKALRWLCAFRSSARCAHPAAGTSPTLRGHPHQGCVADGPGSATCSAPGRWRACRRPRLPPRLGGRPRRRHSGAWLHAACAQSAGQILAVMAARQAPAQRMASDCRRCQRGQTGSKIPHRLPPRTAFGHLAGHSRLRGCTCGIASRTILSSNASGDKLKRIEPKQPGE